MRRRRITKQPQNCVRYVEKIKLNNIMNIFPSEIRITSPCLEIITASGFTTPSSIISKPLPIVHPYVVMVHNKRSCLYENRFHEESLNVVIAKTQQGQKACDRIELPSSLVEFCANKRHEKLLTLLSFAVTMLDCYLHQDLYD